MLNSNGSSLQSTDDGGLNKSNKREMEVLVMNFKFVEALASRFEGACVDSGAERAAIGPRQAELHCQLVGKHFIEAPFRF